jgi:hypothetical protein
MSRSSAYASSLPRYDQLTPSPSSSVTRSVNDGKGVNDRMKLLGATTMAGSGA